MISKERDGSRITFNTKSRDTDVSPPRSVMVIVMVSTPTKPGNGTYVRCVPSNTSLIVVTLPLNQVEDFK